MSKANSEEAVMWLELICDQSWDGIIYDANISWNLAIGHLDQNCGGNMFHGLTLEQTN